MRVRCAAAGWASTAANAPCWACSGRDGVFAEYTLLPLQNLHAVPEHVPDEVAVFTEPLAAAYELLEQVPFAPAQHVVILGDGRLGLLSAFVLAQTGCDLTVLRRPDADKLALLAPAGVGTCLATEEALRELAASPADIVVEATGDRHGFAAALRLVRPGGVLALKSTFADHLDDFDLSHLVVDEITLIGSRCGPFARRWQHWRAARSTPRPLIHAETSLDEDRSGYSACG